MTYQEKLKDTRWQKKRLEILQRDNWACKSCGKTDKTLHVHHLFYSPNQDPWNISNGFLVTLCEDCHENKSIIEDIRGLIARLLSEIWSNDEMLGGHDYNTQLTNSIYILK